MHNLHNSTMPHFQKGATLVVALVLLAAITIIGVSNMQSSSLQMKMVTSTTDRNRAFILAEGALTEAENLLENGFFDNDDLFTDTCTDKCFTRTCADGLCFDGIYQSADSRFDCQVAPNATVNVRVRFWRDDTVIDDNGNSVALAVWDNARYREVSINGVDVKYIYEFLCFVDDGSGSFGSDSLGMDESAGVPLFRITVLAGDDSDLAPVMLQTTYTPSSL